MKETIYFSLQVYDLKRHKDTTFFLKNNKKTEKNDIFELIFLFYLKK